MDKKNETDYIDEQDLDELLDDIFNAADSD